MHKFAFHNGELKELDKIVLPITDLGFQRGYAIFDFFYVNGRAIPFQKDYFNRFYRSIALSAIQFDTTKDQILEMVFALGKKNQVEKYFIKLILSGGQSSDGYTYEGNNNFVMLALPYSIPNPKLFTEGINLALQEYQRDVPEVKTTNYFMSASLHQKIRKLKAIDVLYHYNGTISETSRANFYAIKNGQVFTREKGILKGITRKHVLQTFANSQPIQFLDIPLEFLTTMDEAFITSTTKGILPVVAIEGKRVGDGKVGPVVRGMMKAFNQVYD